MLPTISTRNVGGKKGNILLNNERCIPREQTIGHGPTDTSYYSGLLILCVYLWEVRLYYETLDSFVVHGFVLFTKLLSLIKVGPSWKLKSLYFFDLHLSEK